MASKVSKPGSAKSTTSSVRTSSTARPSSSGSSSNSTGRTQRSGGMAKYDVNLGSGRVSGNLGRTPSQRQRSAGVQRNMVNAPSSSDPGGFKASGLPASVAPYLSRPSTAGRTQGREVTSAPSTGGTRPSSVARGTTAGAGTVGAITKAAAKAPSAGRGQKVTKQSAKDKGRSSSARSVRF